MRLDGNPARLLAAKASGNGARALATICTSRRTLSSASTRPAILLGPALIRYAAPAHGTGMLVVRLLSRDRND